MSLWYSNQLETILIDACANTFSSNLITSMERLFCLAKETAQGEKKMLDTIFIHILPTA